MTKITIIGAGYVGLTSAVCFANSGHKVICIDKDLQKVKSLQNGIPTIFEENLEEDLRQALNNKNIEFSSDLEKGIKFSQAIILAVGTPQDEQSGKADLSYIYSASQEIARYIDEYKLIITKSTVPVGTNHEIKKIIEENCSQKIDVASNPEFMREGFAIQDFMKPDRIVIGVDNQKSQKILEEIYQPWIKQNYKILTTDIKTAELIKYASNAFLMTKVAFINEIETLSNKLGANIKDLTLGMGLDERIGNKFLNPSPGIGGSCFPKDSLALEHIAKNNGVPLSILSQVIQSNFQRFKDSTQKIQDFSRKNSNFDKKISILGLAFKAGTDDVRMSPAIEIIKNLLENDFKIAVYDPQALENSKKILGDKVSYSDSLQDCYNKSSDIIILTEWQEFKNIKNFPDFNKKNVLDLRYIL